MLENLRFPLFVTAIAVQLGGVLFFPVRSSIIRAQGKEIALELAPVDPYDMLTGYSVDISYRISRLDSYPPLNFSPKRGQVLYVTLAKGTGKVWDPVSVGRDWPRKISPNQVVMKGVYDERDWVNGIWFGIEKMYIPEARREEVNIPDVLNPHGQRDRISGDEVRADIRVDSRGNASLVRLHVVEKVFE